MSKLLSANFARLKKDRVFWLGILCMFLFGIFLVSSNYYNMKKYDYQITLDNFFFSYATFIGIVASVFCSLYLGTEYSNGTIRNKIVVGHIRKDIYLSNLIISFIANIFMALAFIIPTAALGIPLFGFFKTSINIILLYLFGSIVMIAALSALFTLICMLVSSKAVTAVIAIIGIFVLLLAAFYINIMLQVPPTYENYEFIDETGTMIKSSEIANPNYISGTKRVVYKKILDIIPTGQALQYSNMEAIHLWQMPLYSFIITITTTGLGIFLFGKKDLK